MKLRDNYIQMRNQGIIDLNFLYSYYRDKGGRADSNTFQQAIHLYHLDTNQLTQRLDSEFELDILLDEQGNFIKIIN